MGGKGAKREEKRSEGQTLWACSGQTEHHEQCNLEECRPLTETEILINAELQEWAKAGMDTAQTGFNVFYIDARLSTIVEVLLKKELVSQEDMDEVYQRTILENLIKFRAEIQPQLQRARMGLNGMPPGVLGPDGRPIH